MHIVALSVILSILVLGHLVVHVEVVPSAYMLIHMVIIHKGFMKYVCGMLYISNLK
jgi:hypothetical protein